MTPPEPLDKHRALDSSIFRRPPESTSAESDPADTGRSRTPHFHGDAGTLFGIHVVNVLLTLVTLGVYYFWAKTRVRHYVFGQTAIEGDRFAYHGAGAELLLGTLKAALVFGLPVLGLNLVRDVFEVPEPVKAAAGVLAGALVFVFLPVALVGGRRYRLSRTSWRGIRFSFRGHVRDLIKIFIRGGLFTAVTLGFYTPFFQVNRQAFLVTHSYFGSRRFEFTGRGQDLVSPFVVAVLLTLPTLGLGWVWYLAHKRRYFWDHTRFETARFGCSVTGKALLALWAVNLLALVGTLGLAWPWVRVRNIRFAFRNLTLIGPLDLGRIQQQAQHASPFGEGLSGFFDSGFDLA